LARRGGIYLAVSELPPFPSSLLNSVPSQSRSSPTKWVFLFTRYFGLFVQARLLSVNLSLVLDELSVDICRELYICQVVFGGLLLACIQAILMLRVYALYIKDRRIAYAMIALLVAEVGSMPGIIYKTIPTDVGLLCMKPIDARDIVLFGVSAILPQLFVLGLTITRFLSGLRAGWGRIPVVSRLVQDDIILVSFILIWAILGVCLTSVKNVYGYIVYYWLLSIIPSAGCRIVISMQKVADTSKHAAPRQQAEASSSDSSLELTTCLFDVLSLNRCDRTDQLEHRRGHSPEVNT